MDERASIEQRLCRIFERQMHLSVPSTDTDLFDTGGLDSLSFVELLLFLERDFGVHVSLDVLQLDHFRSIASIARFIVAEQRRTQADAVRPLKRGGAGTQP